MKQMINIDSEKKIEWFKWLKGDKVIWTIVIILSLSSIFLVYSASTNLQYVVKSGTVFGHTFKHFGFIILGLLFMGIIPLFFKYEYMGVFSPAFLLISAVLLGYASFSGQEIDGASAARWINIAGITFQPSTLAYLALIVYICRYLTKNISRERLPIENILYLFGPVLIVFALVGKENGSTALIILGVSLLVMAMGGLPLKYIFGFLGLASLLVGIFVYLALNTNLIKSNRVHTWISRIEVYLGKESKDIDDETLKAKTYQVDRAKAAIVHGGLTGVGPGKSALKQSLPQSTSDFIFAIIVEEYGLVGASFLMLAYIIILVRIVMIAIRTPSFFGTLLVLSIGIMLFVQMAVNIAVAVNMFPVTGQPLPLISYGGTSMLVTYIQLGIILNISSRIQVLDEEGIGRKQSIEEINDIA